MAENNYTPSAGFAVFVTNISPSANEKTLSDFFSFCGKITKLTLKNENNGTNSAIIYFEADTAAKTALLLTNALIVDRPITVSPISEGVAGSVPTTTETPQPSSTTTETEKSTTKPSSVIASILAAGYVLGKDAVEKAKQVDDTLNISNRVSAQVKTVAETVQKKVEEIDTKLKVSETANTVKTNVEQKTTQLKTNIENAEVTKKITTEVNTKITPEINSWFGTMQNVATNLYTVTKEKVNQIAENPTVAKGIGMVSGATSYVTTTITGIQEETKHAIDEINRTRAVQQPPSAVPPTHTPGADSTAATPAEPDVLNTTNVNPVPESAEVPPPTVVPPVEKPLVETPAELKNN